MQTLHKLAEAAGLALRWRDVHGQFHDVGPETLRAVLAALSLPADSDAAIADSLASLNHPARLPPLLTADCGGPCPCRAATTTWCWRTGGNCPAR